MHYYALSAYKLSPKSILQIRISLEYILRILFRGTVCIFAGVSLPSRPDFDSIQNELAMAKKGRESNPRLCFRLSGINGNRGGQRNGSWRTVPVKSPAPKAEDFIIGAPGETGTATLRHFPSFYVSA